MKIYQFKMWGKQFAVDSGTGNFFETDKIASDAIKLFNKYPDEATVIAKLKKVYAPQAVIRAIRSLSSLSEKGLLLTQHKTADKKMPRRITDLTLNIVNSCNLRCRYCWNEAGAYGHSINKIQNMPFSVARKAVDLLIKESKGAQDLVVDFYGGEPLLNYQLIKEVIAYCKKIEKRKQVKFHFLLATNATLLDKEKGNFLVENGVDIAVSIDGPRKIQDSQRPFPDGRGSFEAIIHNLNSLKKGYLNQLVGRATFTPYSTRVVSTFRFLRSLGFDRIEVCESEKAGYGLDLNNQFFFSGLEGVRRLKTIYSTLARFYAQEIIKGKLNYKNTYFNRFFKQLSRLYHIQSIVGSCSAGFSLMAVDMDGGIYPCTAFVGMPQFKIGSVTSGIQETKIGLFLDTKILSNKACAQCWAKKICRGCGSCYNLNYFSNKNLKQPNPYYCELFRYKTKLMIAMIAFVSQKYPSLLNNVLIPEYFAARGKRK